MMEDNIWDLFEILVSIYEGFNLYYYIFAFLDYNFKSQRSKITYSAGARSEEHTSELQSR